VAKVLFDTFCKSKIELTAAGTVSDLHRIPFYLHYENNANTKIKAKVDIILKNENFFKNYLLKNSD